MDITLTRLRSNNEATIGILFIDEVFECFTCEDAPQVEKIPGRTRIPAGRYEIKFRKESPMAHRYGRQFTGINHRGMLWLQDVPGFEFVYLHIGNSHDDTKGCPLVGRDVWDYKVGRSMVAYKSIYKKIANAIDSGEIVMIRIFDENEAN